MGNVCVQEVVMVFLLQYISFARKYSLQPDIPNCRYSCCSQLVLSSFLFTY